MYNDKSMKLILLQDDKKLGVKGDIIDVSEGFAFNNLIPQGIAKIATKTIIAEVERKRIRQEEEKAKQKEALQEIAKKIDKKKITILQKAKDTKLFGSVSAKDISAAIKEQHNMDIAETMIMLNKPIKELTTREIEINFNDDVKAGVIVTIAAK